MEIGPVPRHSIALPITEGSQVGEARRIAIRFGADLGFTEHDTAVVGLVVTELANNLVKYAQDGKIILRALGDTRPSGLEILSVDSGPGIVDTAKHVADGYSTGTTPGNGLGAVRRLSRQFDIYSAAGAGTTIMARLLPTELAPEPVDVSHMDYGVVCVPKRGEQECGDSWGVYRDTAGVKLMLVDGLGHGQIASVAAKAAVQVFERHRTSSSLDIIETAHGVLRSTRGAVMAVAEISASDGAVKYTGVGNIGACIAVGARCEQMISMNGTLGYAAKPRSFSYTCPKPSTVILSSDGISARWQLEKFPGLIGRHPSLIAGMLYQHYNRGHDDATILVARWT